MDGNKFQSNGACQVGQGLLVTGLKALEFDPGTIFEIQLYLVASTDFAPVCLFEERERERGREREREDDDEEELDKVQRHVYKKKKKEEEEER